MAKEKAKKSSAFMAPVQVSKDLGEIVGNKLMPRTEVTKKLWEYIKEKGLQDKKKKKYINPDDKLGKVLGSKQTIDMFEMTKKISKHIEKPAAAAASKAK
jgi:chromatin remodeling complex protein RSC6